VIVGGSLTAGKDCPKITLFGPATVRPQHRHFSARRNFHPPLVKKVFAGGLGSVGLSAEQILFGLPNPLHAAS